MKPEDAEAIALCEWWARAYPQHAGKLVHLGNETYRGTNEGAYLGALRRRKARGVVAGASDYFLAVPVPPKSQCGLWLELKAPGKPVKRDQIAFLEAMAPHYGAAVAWGWVGAKNAVTDYLMGILPLGRVDGFVEVISRPLSAFTLTGTLRRIRA